MTTLASLRPIMAVAWLGLLILRPAAADRAYIAEFPTPSPQSLPQGLDIALDGGVFYTETAAGKIVHLQGRQTREFALPKGAAPNVLKIGGEGVWFSDGGNAAIGLLQPESGSVTEYPVPSGAPPNFLQIARDGSIWFTEPSGVGRLSRSKVVTEWRIALEKSDSHIEQIAVDPFGFVWFTELNYDGVGSNGTNFVRRLDPATNTVRAYPVPTFGGTPAGVTAAPSGHIWVSEYFAGKLALLDPETAPHTTIVVTPLPAFSRASNSRAASTLTPAAPVARQVSPSIHYVSPARSSGWLEYTIPTPGANAEDMRLGPDGRLYFEEDGGYLGILTPASGEFVEFPIPSPNSGYYNIALGDGVLWFAEAGAFSSTAVTKVGVLRTTD